MKALLIDDDKNLTKVLSYQLRKNNFEVEVASSGDEGLKIFRQNKFGIVLTDVQMPGLSGIKNIQG